MVPNTVKLPTFVISALTVKLPAPSPDFPISKLYVPPGTIPLNVMFGELITVFPVRVTVLLKIRSIPEVKISPVNELASDVVNCEVVSELLVILSPVPAAKIVKVPVVEVFCKSNVPDPAISSAEDPFPIVPLPLTTIVPLLIVVLPVSVLAAVNVKVPVPSFVQVPDPVTIGSFTVIFPEAPKVPVV